jgi:DNA-binding beta-propeller fold protein YncE
VKVTPAGIARGPDGNYYVADEYSHNIFKFDADWNRLTQWGGQTQDHKKFHPTMKAHFDKLRGVAVGPLNGCVYVSDWGADHRIQVFSPDHQHLDTPH